MWPISNLPDNLIFATYLVLLPVYDLVANIGWEDLITSPVMIDGKGIQQRLKEQQRHHLQKWSEQDAEYIRQAKSFLGLFVKSFVRIIMVCTIAITYSVDFIFASISSGKARLDKKLRQLRAKAYR